MHAFIAHAGTRFAHVFCGISLIAGLAVSFASAGVDQSEKISRAAMTSPVLEFIERPGVQEFSGSLIVRPLRIDELQDRGFTESEALTIHGRAGDALAAQRDEYVPQTDIHVVRVPAGLDESSYATQLMATGMYAYAHPNWVCYPVATPDDTYFSSQWHLSTIRCPEAWDLWTGSDEIITAFTDTGIYIGHPDLDSSRVSGYNSASRKTEKNGGDVSAIHWHGTHVAGCASAITDNGQGVAGVGWNFKIMPIRVTNQSGGGATLADLMNGATWAADNGAKVISASYSGVHSQGIQDTGKYIRSVGALYLYAAGNDNRNLSGFDWADVIIVGATDSGDNKASFSAYGKAVDLFAPGVDILSTYINNDYAYASGTSMATPVANGVCALVWSIDLSLTPKQVEDIVEKACKDLGDAGNDTYWGWGRVDAFKAVCAHPAIAVAIESDPDSLVVDDGESASFTVIASGAQLSYQWQKNGVNIDGATSDTYTIEQAHEGDEGSYTAIVSNPCGAVTSNVATLTVESCTSPLITDQPDATTACAGSSATLSALASGSGPLSYQWRKGGGNINGATNSTLTIDPVGTGDAGDYDVVVTNNCGTATSNAATLTVNTGPSITDQPDAVELCAGEQATFSVSAGGTAPLTYQWRKNGGNINGATADTLTINSVASGDAGNYDVVVTNGCGNTTSATATLVVDVKPSISDQPDSLAVCPGSAMSMSVSAGGSQPLSYQWRKDGDDIAGATNSTLTIDPVGSGDIGSYDCVITNACGSATSNAATLSLNETPSITDAPDALELCAGGQATFSVAAGGTAPLSYQWRKNGDNISGATSNTLTINPVGSGDAGDYDVVVTNSCGSATSTTAALVANAGPSITDQPDSTAICAGDPATLSVSVDGIGPLSYQWRKNGGDINGATDPSFTISAVAPGDAGDYDVVVTNGCGNTTSAAATLSVDTAPEISDQPDSIAVCIDGTATMSVSATGSGPLSYQWRESGNEIVGATESTLTINPVGSGDADSYDVVITNGCGSVISSAATLTVNSPPSITDPPDSIGLCTGADATFSASADGTEPLSYQWRKGGEDITGATDSTLTISSIDSGDAGEYDVVVTNNCGAATSTSATLSVDAGPAITESPQSQTKCAGDSVTFSVAATGGEPLSYQWRHEETNIDGATGPTLTIDGVSNSNAGTYDVIVTNGCGSATSAAATLIVIEQLSVTDDPDDAVACIGAAVSFSVAAEGATAYQWRHNGVVIDGATSAEYSIASVQAGDEGDYDVVISSNCGELTSNPATLTTLPGAVITDSPDDTAACEGESIELAVSAENATGYQWRFNTTPISGATDATYHIEAATSADAGSYDVVVTGDCGDVISDAAIITVGASPTISQQPADASACTGGTAEFSVSANDASSYQWRKEGIEIAGATGSTLTIDPVASSDVGSYDVVVTNDCGSLTSEAATLTVTPGATILSSPQSAAICDGDSVTFTVSADNATGYQWRFDSSPISGATDATYSIEAATSADAGNYDVVVFGECGNVTSDTATLTVGAAPTITDQPDGVSACPGDGVTLSVSANNATGYQWRFNGNAIDGAASSTYSIAAVQPTDAGSYDVLVTGECGMTTSVAAVLTVGIGPSITDQPDDLDRCIGDSAELSVAANDATGYQWRLNGSPISGATSATYHIAAVAESDAGSYDVVVTGECGEETSASATLSIGEAPTIESQPADVDACLGDEATFQVAATGATAYQWRKDGHDILGATEDHYTIATVGPFDFGTYDVIVRSNCGTVTSETAKLTIGVGPRIDSDPQHVSICRTGTVSFTVTAKGATMYQWRRDGNPLSDGGNISGASTSTLTINPATTDDAANYDVVVSNDCGSQTSTVAALSVFSADRGDSDGSGAVDFNDIDCFVAALISFEDWESCGGSLLGDAAYLCANDTDQNGGVDFNDIDSFVQCIIDGECQ